jgi:C4-dicarboxylate-binding protein DctP
MKNFKRIVSLTLVCAFVLLVSACGAPAATPAASAASAASAAPATASGKAEFTLKLSHDHQVTSPFQISSEWFKNEIETKTGGRIAVEIYPAQQLGSAREMIEGMQMGTVEAVLLPTAKFGGFDQKLNMSDMPYLFPNDEALWAMLEGEVGQMAMAGLPDIGILGVQYFAEGWHFLTSNVPIKTPADLKGLKMRTMEAPIIMDTFTAWGSNPVPIDFAEVYNSLQQNVVDGHENPIISIHDMKFYEVQKYMTQLNHGYLSYFLSYSKSWYDSLPVDLQEIVMQAGLDCAQYHKTLMEDTNATYMKNIEDFGNTQVVYLTPEEITPFREAVMPLYDKYREMLGDELLDLALETAAQYE